MKRQKRNAKRKETIETIDFVKRYGDLLKNIGLRTTKYMPI